MARAELDALIDGIHFRSAWCAPRDAGHKAMAAALSDLAAMGGTDIDELWAQGGSILDVPSAELAACACDCHADPQCDGVTNVLDVVNANLADGEENSVQ